jgi:hypothetical protein
MADLQRQKNQHADALASVDQEIDAIYAMEREPARYSQDTSSFLTEAVERKNALLSILHPDQVTNAGKEFVLYRNDNSVKYSGTSQRP